MENKARPWFFLSMLLHLFISLKNSLSTDVHSISMDQTLSGDQTISSKGDIFELGFFKPGKSQNYYMGIWYKQLSERTVVWVANRETPLPNKYSARLKIDQDGNLVLLNQLETPIWSTDVSTIASNSTVAELLDTGNFVLRDGSDSSAVIWQSFDHPTDTVLPKGWFGRNMITGEIKPLISWKSHEDPALGMFSCQIDSNGNDQFSLLWNRSEVYWRGGVGNQFNRVVEINSGHFLNFSYFNKEGRNYFTYNPVDSSFITRAVLDKSGRVQLRAWLESSRQWKHVWVQPTTQCEVYSLCGSFGVCTENSQPCSCLRGFETKSMEGWNMSDPSAVGSAKECELSCLSHCSCTAYAYKNGCSLWNGDLINLQQLSDGEGQDLFVRLAASELRSFGPKKRRIDEATLGVVVGCASVFGVITIVLIWRCRRRQQKISWMVVQNSLVSFSYRDLQIITKNFSEKLGRGSFGSVFKGSLPDSTPIAVKKLEGLAQGEKQFRAEVSTIGAIQHINLIRLRGFCSQVALKHACKWPKLSEKPVDTCSACGTSFK
ncbi:G-type lectin S-receptor-like serine/threonine-protein kinase [Cinnamomum micranthum f. kanehirae]|uniref:G-type lectin S-receptor-like serine/threonine-protein kinase n=1 Tax=Cinnamomum micranthum f. kanehirae TaxID=337451 RepID=A0A3S3NA33_9MAGN|nr:G-type lectin S-receptor-like serine/threonine-protein kinase [Cinnamomum micranthum f. kanehirae]